MKVCNPCISPSLGLGESGESVASQNAFALALPMACTNSTCSGSHVSCTRVTIEIDVLVRQDDNRFKYLARSKEGITMHRQKQERPKQRAVLRKQKTKRRTRKFLPSWLIGLWSCARLSYDEYQSSSGR